MRSLVLLTAALLAVSLWPAWAVADATDGGTVELSSRAEIEVRETLEDGSLLVRRQPATQVVPGDEVIFTLSYRNFGDQPAEDIFITNPIPEHMEFQSAAAPPPGARITYSVDGGRSFDELSNLRSRDDQGRARAAVAADCTHIRWTFEEPLRPGAAGSVAYTALLQ